MRTTRILVNALLIAVVCLGFADIALPQVLGWFGAKTTTTTVGTVLTSWSTSHKYHKTTMTITTTSTSTTYTTETTTETTTSWVERLIQIHGYGCTGPPCNCPWVVVNVPVQVRVTLTTTKTSTTESTTTTTVTSTTSLELISIPIISVSVATIPVVVPMNLQAVVGSAALATGLGAATGATANSLVGFGRAGTLLWAGAKLSGAVNAASMFGSGLIWSGVKWVFDPPGAGKPGLEHYAGLVVFAVLTAIAYAQYRKYRKQQERRVRLMPAVAISMPIPMLAFIISDLLELDLVAQVVLFIVVSILNWCMGALVFGRSRGKTE